MSDDSLSIEFSLVPDEPREGISDIRLVCEADESTVLMFRGAIVEDDGMTSWERRIAELEAEVERLRADGERLDWMEAQMQSKNCWLPGYNRHTQTWFVVDEAENEPTFRAALDAARKELK